MPVRRRRPSASCFTPASPTSWVRSTTATPKWTGWCRSRRPWHHDHVGGDDLRVARAPSQHHRHPGARRLHCRGRAFAARARRRRCHFRCRCRRRAADRDGLAPGRSVQRSAHRLRQQDGSRRRQLRSLCRDDDRPAERQDGARTVAVGRRRRIRRRHRCHSPARHALGR